MSADPDLPGNGYAFLAGTPLGRSTWRQVVWWFHEHLPPVIEPAEVTAGPDLRLVPWYDSDLLGVRLPFRFAGDDGRSVEGTAFIHHIALDNTLGATVAMAVSEAHRG